MQIPGITKPIVWWGAGATVGFAILFSHGQLWLTSSKARAMATQHANAAVVAALAPVCVDSFKRAADAAANLAALKKISSEYQQDEFVEKGGWATVPGSEKHSSAVAKACAQMLTGRS